MTASPSLSDRALAAVERFSLRNFVLAIIAAVLLAGLAAAYTLTRPAEYRSTAVLIIDSPLAIATSGNDGVVNKLEELRGKYATLAKTQAMADPVAAATGLGVREVIRDTNVQPTVASLGMTVTAVGTDPDRVRALAKAMSEEVGDFVAQEHEAHSVPPEDRFVIDVVQPASPAAKTSPSTDRALSSAGVVFLAALAVAYLVLQLLRPPIPVGQRIGPDVPPTEPSAPVR